MYDGTIILIGLVVLSYFVWTVYTNPLSAFAILKYLWTWRAKLSPEEKKKRMDDFHKEVRTGQPTRRREK